MRRRRIRAVDEKHGDLVFRQFAKRRGLKTVSKNKNPLPCFVCGKELGHCGGDLGNRPFLNNQPCDGIGFGTEGHYGSAAFDPGREGHWLELAICDDCLLNGRDRTREITVHPGPNVLRLVEGEGRELSPNVLKEDDN